MADVIQLNAIGVAKHMCNASRMSLHIASYHSVTDGLIKSITPSRWFFKITGTARLVFLKFLL